MQKNDIVIISAENSLYRNYKGQIRLKGPYGFNVKIFGRELPNGVYDDKLYKVFKEYDLIKISKED